METAQDYLQAAGKSLDRGETTQALIFAQHASSLTRDTTEKARAEQLEGICNRLLGQYDAAQAFFAAAYSHAEDDLLRGRIQRDWGMMFLARQDTLRAMVHMLASKDLIGSVRSDRPHDDEVHTEYYVTVGFIGRVHLANKRKPEAREALRVADAYLRGYAPYELNNLVWRLKTMHLPSRLKHGWRALRLATAAGHHRRQIEVVLMTLSPALARRVSARQA